MTAKEARDLMDMKLSGYNEIISDITNAAKKGESFIDYRREWSQDTLDKLREDGFTVEWFSTKVQISW